jgi:hypothetical protein
MTLIGFWIVGAGLDRTASTRNVIEIAFGGSLGFLSGFYSCWRVEQAMQLRRRARGLRVMMENVTKGICTEI